MNNKVLLIGPFRRVEMPAVGVVVPGSLIEQVAGTATTGAVQPHSTAGGFGETLFAEEDALQGRTIADNYALGEIVTCCSVTPGTLVNALLLAGSNYTVGTKLISDGAGRLKPTTGSPSKIFGIIVEAIDLSASGAVNTLGKMRCW